MSKSTESSIALNLPSKDKIELVTKQKKKAFGVKTKTKPIRKKFKLVVKRRARKVIRRKRIATGMPRDSQRQKFYNTTRSYLDDGMFFSSIYQVQEYVNELVEIFKVPPIRVTTSSSKHTSRAYLETRVIRLAIAKSKTNRNKGFYEFIVLHEVAHLLTPSKYAGHGPEYVQVFLYLIENFISYSQLEGAAYYQGVRQKFIKDRIKISLDHALDLMNPCYTSLAQQAQISKASTRLKTAAQKN